MPTLLRTALHTATLALFAALPASAQEVTLDIRLDPATLASLQANGEMVVISSWYYGEPAPGAKTPTNEVGTIDLASEQATIAALAAFSVRVGGSLGSIPLTEVLTPMLNVNVYSARLSSEDNLLDCDFLEGPVADLAKAPQVIRCKLLPNG